MNISLFLKTTVALACGLGALAASAATVQVTGNVSGNVTWFGTNEYVLNSKIYVLSNAVLTV